MTGRLDVIFLSLFPRLYLSARLKASDNIFPDWIMVFCSWCCVVSKVWQYHRGAVFCCAATSCGQYARDNMANKVWTISSMELSWATNNTQIFPCNCLQSFSSDARLSGLQQTHLQHLLPSLDTFRPISMSSRARKRDFLYHFIYESLTS